MGWGFRSSLAGSFWFEVSPEVVAQGRRHLKASQCWLLARGLSSTAPCASMGLLERPRDMAVSLL